MQLENTTPFEAELTGGFESSGHECVIVAVKGTFVLPNERGEPCLMASEQQPLSFADEFGEDPAFDCVRVENDFAPFKPKCDVIVDAPAIAPDGAPVTQLPVGVRIGNWSKHFVALGSRIWLRGAAGFHVSEMRPFVRQAIDYDHAYGGTDPEPDRPDYARTYETNPAGVGYYPLREDLEGLPVAQTMPAGGADPVSRDGGYPPLAFGPIGRAWLPRRTWVGTYDDAWLKHHMPFPPHDLDQRYFQATVPDQWIDFPQGGEPVEIVHLTPVARVVTRLPQVSVVINFNRRSGRVTQKLANLDTVLVLGEAMQLCLTWRARLVTERDLFEVESITISSRGELPAVKEAA